MYLHLIIFLLFHELHKVGFLLDIQNIGLSKRKVGYLLDLRNGGHSKFDIQILEKLIKNILPFALMSCIVKKQNAVSECESGLFFYIGHSLFNIKRQ